jgi:hypothetical protein
MEEQIIQLFLQNSYCAISAPSINNNITIIICINNGIIIKHLLKNIFKISKIEDKGREFNFYYKKCNINVINAHFTPLKI